MDKPIKILGVDDKPGNLLALEAVLEALDIEFIKAYSGQQALEFVLKEDVALILMDVQMPDMDGFETAEVIRTNKRTGHIPIIFITAISFERRHVFKGYDSGAVDYLFKPIDPGILRSKVSVFIELFRQRETLRQKAIELERANQQILDQQNAIEQSEVRFRTAFGQAFQFMAILDPDGRIVEMNDLARNLSDGNEDAVFGRFLWDAWRFGTDAEKDQLKQSIEKAAAGDVVSEEAMFYDHKGMMLYILRTVSPVRNEDGSVIYITVQGQNITKRKLAEEDKLKLETQLRQAQKMEALGTLAGGIAHDFNNILSVILGYADMGRRIIPEESRGYQYLSKILLASNKARDLVRQILCFSRRAETEEISFRPSPIIREAIKMLRSTIPTTIEIRENIDTKCGAIFADPTQFHQVLMNLCTNAYHAMESTGGIMEILLDEIRLTPSNTPGGMDAKMGWYAHLAVIDSGRGMDADVMEKMYDPYFTTKEVGKGTGLGLSIVHGIVKRHNGYIHVDSEVGKGTRFDLYFPIVERRKGQKKKKSAAIAPGRGNILLIDDEAGLLEMAKEMMEMMGYDVTASLDSLEALELFQASPNRFDLVVTDQTMPRMTGVELAARMLEIHPDFPIILCTGHSPDISRDSVREMGIKDLLIKPLEIESISKMIREALAHR